jgi:hypothetical protein
LIEKIKTILGCLHDGSVYPDFPKKLLVGYLLAEQQKIFSLAMLKDLAPYIEDQHLAVLCPPALLREALAHQENPILRKTLQRYLVHRTRQLCATKTPQDLPVNFAQKPEIKDLVNPKNIVTNVNNYLMSYQRCS